MFIFFNLYTNNPNLSILIFYAAAAAAAAAAAKILFDNNWL